MRNLIKSGLKTGLKSGLKRLSPTESPLQPRLAMGEHLATVVAVATQKGGVGKTTTSVNLASALARYEDKRVLLIDLDPQGHVHTALKTQIRPGGGPLSLVLCDEGGRREVMEIAAPTNHASLHITPFDGTLASTENLMNSRIGKEFILRDALKVTRTHYDVILIDCPPNLGNLTLNALVAADQVLIPCDPSPLALNGVHALVDAIHTVAQRLNPDLDVLGLLLTRIDGRNTTLNQAILDELETHYGSIVLSSSIGICSSLARAQLDGCDIFAYAGSSRGAKQYRALAELLAPSL